MRDKVEDEYEDLEKRRDDAIEQLDAVLAESSLKDRHGKARELRGKVTEWWASIEKMTRGLRGANHPVVAFMLREGQAAHKERQSASSHCDVSAFRMDSGEADCLTASSSGCFVIELKPNNSKAVRKGRAQAERYAAELRKKGKAFQALVEKNRKFAQCSGFEVRVDCYRLCPSIDDSGEFREASPDWKKECS